MASISSPTCQWPLTPPSSPHPSEKVTPFQIDSTSPKVDRWNLSSISLNASPPDPPNTTPDTRFKSQRPISTKPATACSLRALYNAKQAWDGPNNNPPILAPRPLRARSVVPELQSRLGLPSPRSTLRISIPSTANPYKPHHVERSTRQDLMTPPLTVPPMTQQRKNAFPSPSTMSQMLLTPSLISDLLPLIPSLLSRVGWDRPTAHLCHVWALKNPRMALLLYMTDNLCCWPIAAIFSPLEDSLLPLSEFDIANVVSNSMAVMDAQWRVVEGALPPLGAHFEIRPNECLPLTAVSPVRLQMGSRPEGIEKVRWKGVGSEVYARKCIKYTGDQLKAEVMGQVETLKELQHRSIIELRCTYAVGDLLYVLMPLSDTNLESFLELPSNDDRADRMRNWLVDLMSALEYMHSFNIRHQSVRPTKILIIGDRILFGTFGIGKPPDNELPKLGNSPCDESAVYAAPEVVARNKYFRASDVFALGCIFLEMMTVMKGHTVEAFRSFRRGDNDASFQGNLDQVLAWIQLLEARAGFGLRDEFMSDGMALTLISWMVDEEHAKRPKARVLAASFDEWSSGRVVGYRPTVEENAAI